MILFGRMIALATAIIAALFGASSAAAVLPAHAPAALVYTYDCSNYDTPSTYTAPERGPPTARVHPGEPPPSR